MAMSEDGFGGLLAISLLGALALAGVIDVFVNDILPDRYSINCTHRHRHVVFMLMAIGQVALVLALAKVGDLKPSAGRYALDAVMSVWLACVGVADHFRYAEEARQDRISQRADL